MDVLTCRDYIENFLKIRTKDGKLQPFRLNAAQERLYAEIKRQWDAGKPARIIILKARQMGFSTLTEGIIFFLTATARFSEALIVAHTEDATGNLFRMSQRFLENLPSELKPMTRSSNAREIVFAKPSRSPSTEDGLQSRIRCATAGGQSIGRSYTLKALHLSEFAFWPGDKKETFSGLMQAVPDNPGTLIVIESTANGYDEFKSMWDRAVDDQRRGEDGFIPIFFPWYECEDYRRTAGKLRRTPEEKKLAETYGLDDEQLMWRRWCIRTQCGGDVDLFRQEYPATADEAFVATGRCVFDKDAIVMRRKIVRDLPCKVGQFRVTYKDGRIASSAWEDDPKGVIRIYDDPVDGVPYVIGGDTAGTGSDRFVGQVLDNRSGKQVAVLCHETGERYYAEQMYALGLHYNAALIGVETNYSTYPEMLLEELGYPRLYVRERYDNFTGAMTNAYGYETTSKTRPLMIDNLKDVSRDIDLIADYDTLGEMLTFVYNERWRPEAESGEHDDMVMALAIAHMIRGQQTATQSVKTVSRKWTEDMWEDYQNASPAERKILIERWGTPSER